MAIQFFKNHASQERKRTMTKKWILVGLAAIIMLFGTLSIAKEKKDYYVSEIKISGDVVRSTTLTLEDLRKMRQTTLNSVPKLVRYRGYLGIYDYIGVPLRNVIERAGLAGSKYKQAKHFFVLRAPDGFLTVLSWGEVFNRHDGEQIIIALKSRQVRNAKNELIDDLKFHDLKPRWGGAFRMVIPNDSMYSDERSLKWVSEIYIGNGEIFFNREKKDE